MKNKNITNFGRTALIVLPLFLLSLFLLYSCKEDPVQEDPFFSLEGSPTGLTLTKAAKTTSYVVRSNRPWEVVKKSGADWLKVFPEKGDADGIFKIYVTENPLFVARTENLAFIVDGTEQPVLFRVDQAGNVPYITLPATVTVPAGGGPFSVDVVSNVTWTYSLSDDSWLVEGSVTAQTLNLVAEMNTSDDPREVTLTLTSVDFPDVSESVVLTQSSGKVVLEEDFNWLNYGNVVFYTTTNETRIDNWTQDQKDRGWTSTINTVTGSGNTAMLYARPGFVKVGKTSYGGDLISPAFAKLIGTQTVTVTFKAIPYMTKAGAMDENVLKVSVIGPGTVSQEQFIIDNWPVYPADDGAHTDYCVGMWSAPEATRTFTITGATSETQIKFLGGDYDLTTEAGRPTRKNRIFLDDIKVEIVL